jgi:predicted membrane protein DUF2157
VFSLAPELEGLRDDGALDREAAAHLIAVERREVVSLYAELRFLTWAAVMLVISGVSVLVAHHIDEIGPLVIAAAIGVAAAACYAWAEWKRARRVSLVDDFVLLLASLLLSADVGYIESQWHLLGSAWARHLLVLAIVHAFVAYRFDSRLVLSLSLSALAGYLGVERRDALFIDASVDTGIRAFLCAAICLGWRFVDRRQRSKPTFTPVFEHFAANLAFGGTIAFMSHNDTRVMGCFIALGVAALTAWYGVRSRQEMFLIYAWIYGVIAVDVLMAEVIREPAVVAMFIIISTVVAIVALFVTHARVREWSS